MEPEPLDIGDRIIAMEEARHEENKRLNAEREILLALAPDRWSELKEAFKAECGKVSARSHRLQFECTEPDAQTLQIDRVIGSGTVRVLEFRFNPRVPRIVFELHWLRERRDAIDFVVSGSSVFLSGVLLPAFVANLMIRIAR